MSALVFIRSKAHSAALVVLFFGVSDSRLLAGETWDGGGSDSEWSTGANWNTIRGSQTPPPNDGTADIIMAGTTKLSNQLDVDWDINSLTFNNAAGAFSVNGFSGVTLGIGAGGMSNNDTQLQALLLPIGLNASQTWTAAAGPIILASGINSHFLLPRTLTIAGGFDTTVAGSITNNMTLSKTGAGTLFLVGSDANTYAGTANVTGGTLALSRTGGTDRAIPGNLVIGDGSGSDVVRLDAAEQITSAAGKLVTVNSSGVFNLNGFNETIRDLTINGGSVTTNGGSLTVAGSLSTTGGSVTTGGGALTVAGSLSATGGTLQLFNNASVTSGDGFIGDSVGSSGQVTVSGAGATWTNGAELYVGNAGNGTLEINGGGQVVAHFSYIGNQIGSSGEVTIDGVGSAWTDGGSVYVGAQGHGSLYVTEGGMGNSLGLGAGFFGGVGTITIDGPNSSWTASFGVTIGGNGGNGTLDIINGGQLDNAVSILGGTPGSVGKATIDGTGSTWNTSGPFVAGNDGDGTLDIIAGGQLTSVSGFIASTATAVGKVTIQGAGSTWTNSGNLFVGNMGSGTVDVMNGGQLSSGNAYIGDDPGSMGELTIDGADATFTTTGDLYVGNGGNGSLTISNGSHVESGAGFVGRFSFGEVYVDGVGSSWNATDITVGIDGIGTLSVTAGGTVEAGVQVNPLGEIRGDGTLIGIVENFGLVSPGMSLGALNMDGNYTQTADGELLIELVSTGFDQLLISDVATLAGKLTVSLLDGFVPSIGQTFTFLTADDVDGTFTTEMLPTVPGRIFDVIYNPQSVVLTVSPAFTADFDEDGDVDGDDLDDWQSAYNTSANGDADGDGDSDGRDFLAWQREFGSGVDLVSALRLPPSALKVAVPEPSAWVLLILTVFVGGIARRSRLDLSHAVRSIQFDFIRPYRSRQET